MFRNWSLGRKIAMGFGTVLSLLAVVGVWSVMGVSGVVQNAGEVIQGNQLRGLMVEKEVDHLNWAGHVSELLTNDDVTELDVQTDPHQCAFGKWYYSEARHEAEAMVPGLDRILAEIEEPHKQLHGSAAEIAECFHQADLSQGSFLQDSKIAHLEWKDRVSAAFVDIHTHDLSGVATDPTKCGFGQWLYSDTTRSTCAKNEEFAGIWQEIEENHKALHQSAKTVDAMMRMDEMSSAQEIYLETTSPAATRVLAGIDGLIALNNREVAGMLKAQEIYGTRTQVHLRQVQAYLTEAAHLVSENVMTDEQMLAEAKTTQLGVVTLGVVAIFLGLMLGFIITRSIVKALSRVMEDLNRGSEQVAVASGQVAEASQDMAEGASNQASSLEETSATLEEMASMTRQNAGNAREANELTGNLQKVATNGQDAMTRMSGAIERIKDSSDQTANIIKTIDEIAFQTNLLALNAAVEAARAGDAGKGFAVVAEEVRNLAGRSAEAAQSTSSLIDESQANANGGVQATREVNEVLSQVIEGISRVNELVGAVSQANEEQDRSVGEINKAVGQLDQVTQNNAANAEESASASEELSGQAAELKSMVGILAAIINGGGAEENLGAGEEPALAGPPPVAAPAPRAWHDEAPLPAPPVVRKNEPSQVIPLTEDEMIEL